MELILRATAIFFFLWALTRAMGRRELSELTAFELLLLVTLGDIVQQGVTQEDMSVTGAMLSVGTIAFWVLVLSVVGYRWRRARPLVEGLPLVVVRDGEPVLEVLRLERVTLDELLESARRQGIARLGDVRIGVLEPDGKFSFIRTGETPGGEENSHRFA
jgi:uncharacterized membrane protein YcaP (DUF421 family)